MRDTAGVLALYAAFGSYVYTLALQVTGSPSLAAQTTEDVFLLVWTDPAELGDQTLPVRERLGRLAHRRAVERLRDERSTGSADPGCRASVPLGVLSKLTGGERTALELTYFCGHTLDQAADMLGDPVPSLVGELRSALDKLSVLRRRRSSALPS